MVEKKLDGKVIVISGGTKGVGRAALEEFARHGATVVFSGRDDAMAQQILDSANPNEGQLMFVHTDLRKVEDCKNLFDATFARFGKIDGFFNYAGITPVSPLDTCSEDLFDSIMDTNFKSCFFCCQSAIQYMRKNPSGGSIVFTGSAHAWGGQKDRAAYACSKGVLLTLMEHIAHNYACEHIRCNYLTLGWTPTEGELSLRESQGESEGELRRRAASVLPMGRMLEHSDYVDALVYLMSDASAMMTGSTFRITAGEYI